jgi:hypothetical protein
VTNTYGTYFGASRIRQRAAVSSARVVGLSHAAQ